MKQLFTILMVCSSIAINAQTNFYKQYSSNGYDYGQGIAELPDSSYIITGASSSFVDGPSQMFLLKVDSLGNYIWSKAYGGTEIDWGRRVVHIPGEGFFVGGFTNSSGNGAYDFALWKIDESGNELWFKTYGTDGWEKLNDMALTNDGGVILVGETNKTTDGLTDSYIIKTDANGTLEWTRQLANAGDDNALAIQQFDDTTFIISGYVFNTTTNLKEGWLCRIQDNNTIIWTKNMAGTAKNYEIADIELFNHLIYGVGTCFLDESDSRLYVVKVDGVSQAVISSEVLPNNYFKGVGITTHAAPGLFSVCTAYFEEGVSYGEDDLFMFGYTGDPFYYGDVSSIKYASQQELGQASTSYSSGSVYIGYNEEVGPGGSSIFIMRVAPWLPIYEVYDDFTTSPLVHINFIDNNISTISVYPNPTSDYLQIVMNESFKNTENTIQLIDLCGRTIYSSTSSNSNQIAVDVQKFNPGVYTLMIANENQKFTKRIEVR
ncbi:MAG: T9SS type A sorting domain-containing protein [Crocinitomicaceae bacterium]|nr:T9SS type A sorting domain-containing protein [Crocinitomicaceae bacterium]